MFVITHSSRHQLIFLCSIRLVTMWSYRECHAYLIGCHNSKSTLFAWNDEEEEDIPFISTTQAERCYQGREMLRNSHWEAPFVSSGLHLLLNSCVRRTPAMGPSSRGPDAGREANRDPWCGAASTAVASETASAAAKSSTVLCLGAAERASPSSHRHELCPCGLHSMLGL